MFKKHQEFGVQHVNIGGIKSGPQLSRKTTQDTVPSCVNTVKCGPVFRNFSLESEAVSLKETC